MSEEQFTQLISAINSVQHQVMMTGIAHSLAFAVILFVVAIRK